jgi:hypothetical protein
VRLEVQTDVVQRAALAVADGDHEAWAEEDHHLADLDQLLAVDVARGLEHDEERVAAENLELGTLVGVDGVLDGERVQLEVPAHGLDHARARIVQADPHEAVLAGIGLAQGRLEFDATPHPLAGVVEAAVDHGRADLLLAQRLGRRGLHRARAVGAPHAPAHRDPARQREPGGPLGRHAASVPGTTLLPCTTAHGADTGVTYRPTA